MDRFFFVANGVSQEPWESEGGYNQGHGQGLRTTVEDLVHESR